MADGFAFGLDLGNPGEFSALALVEKATTGTPADSLYTVRDLRRYPPGTAYQAMAADLRARLDLEVPDQADRFPLRGAPVAVDVTATGREVLDTFRVGDPPPHLVPVVLTLGLLDGYDEHGTFRTSKRNRVTRLQVLLQARRLKIANALPEAELLVRELVTYRPRVTLGTDPSQADWRDGQADDLIFALALAVWQADRIPEPDDGLPSVGMMYQGPGADHLRLAGRIRAACSGGCS